MIRREVGALVLATALVGGACVDREAGAEIYTQRGALIVGLDQVSRDLPGSPTLVSPAPVTGLLAGGATDSMVLTIANLPPLAAGAAYQVWLFDDTGVEAPRRIGFTHQLLQREQVGVDPLTGDPIYGWTPVGTPQETQSFAGPAVTVDRTALVVRAGDAVAAGADLAAYTHVVVTIGTGGDASPVNSPAPAWYRYRNSATDAYILGERVRFGFQPSPGYTNIPWSAFGGGTIEFLNQVGFGLMLRGSARPPLGFFYDVWMYDETGAFPPKRIGPLTTPAPEFQPLVDADVTLIPDVVGVTQVVRAARWAEWADLDVGFDDYSTVAVVLRSKQHVGDDVMPPSIIWQALIPPGIGNMPIERERRLSER